MSGQEPRGPGGSVASGDEGVDPPYKDKSALENPSLSLANSMFGRLGDALGTFYGIFASWHALKVSWDVLGLSWEHLGAS